MSLRPAAEPSRPEVTETQPPPAPWLGEDRPTADDDGLAPPATGRPTPEVRRLFVFFAVAYLMQGIGQQAGVVSQPLQNYLKNGLGMGPDDIPKAVAVLVLPWSIKPLYGLLSDLFPIAGYRRRSYLVLMAALAVAGFVWLATAASGASAVIAALFVTAIGIGFSDVLVDALAVENGKRTGWLRQFQAVQWMWISIGLGASSVVGGWLAQNYSPLGALRTAALLPIPLIIALAVMGVRAPEPRAALDRDEVRENLRGVGSALKSATLWRAAAVLVLLGFEPSVGTPFYFYVTDTLKIRQDVYGISQAVGGAGAILGAFVYGKYLAPRFAPRTLLAVILAGGSVATLGLLLIRDAPTLMAVSFFGGIGGILARLVLATIAGEACPKRAEAFTFAGLMGLLNLSTQGGQILGGEIFERLGRQFGPLVWITAATTLLGLAVLPLMPRGAPQRAPEPSQDR